MSVILGRSSDDPSRPLLLESDFSFVSCAVVGEIASFSLAFMLDSAFEFIPMPAALPC
jgi:hypothetical protein